MDNQFNLSQQSEFFCLEGCFFLPCQAFKQPSEAVKQTIGDLFNGISFN